MHKLRLLLIVPVIIISCKSSEKFTGFSYDPPDVTNTLDKEIELPKKRIIGAGNPKIWVSNEFDGARINDFYALNDSTFEVIINPESSPVNNSPWYAFQIWGDTARTITLHLNYNDGEHRYIPKIGTDPLNVSQTPIFYQPNKVTGTGILRLNISKEKVYVRAQKIMPSTTIPLFVDSLNARHQTPIVSIDSIGSSHQNQSIYELQINEVETPIPGVLIVLSRQHPPEISGFLTSLVFLRELASESDLATEFRKYFIVKAYPMINPDGVDNGHWRNNAAGVDLNRDWEYFNQPETRAVRDALLPLKFDASKTVYYGIDFHSTSENVFYPINKKVKTFPDDFTQTWISQIIKDNPNVLFGVEEFDTSSPISKNWLYKTFGCDALTYEVADELDGEQLETVAKNAAQSLMRLLILEWAKNNP